jgi:hypothetical protein
MDYIMEPKIEIRPLTDALPDTDNANKHNLKGMRLVENSMRRRGFFRPIAAAGKGTNNPVIKAGNLTQETAISLGMDKEAIFIYSDGTRPIVHVRTDIAPDSPEAAALAIEDNRSGEESLNWDIDMLSTLAAGDNAVLATLRHEDKVFGGMLEGILQDTLPEFKEYGEDIADGMRVCKCPICGHEHAAKKD